MRFELAQKIVGLERLSSVAAEHRGAGRSVVYCHGCFDVVHPGHVRYLQAAGAHGDVLVVSLTGDDAIEKSDGTRPYIPQEYRAENLAALAFVDHVVIADGPTAEPVIRVLKPDLYVKGSEYEHSDHPGLQAEKALVESFGGRVLFSSGGVVFSSTSILETLGTRVGDPAFDEVARLAANCRRWGVSLSSLRRLIDGDAGKKVVVLGDSLCDRYTFCECGDVADEAPMLSLTPTREEDYLGGAAIIAGHVQAMGANAHLVSTIGADEASEQLAASLDQVGVTHTLLTLRESLPIKQRFLADEQKVMKLNRGDDLPLDSAGERRVLAALDQAIGDWADALIVSDFGFGGVTTSLIDQIIARYRDRVGVLAGDVSGPRRTLAAMRSFDLLTPTERELRAIAGDFDRSLPSVAGRLMQTLSAPCLLATMGPRGAVLFHPRDPQPAAWFEHRLRSEYLPALAERPIDVVGAGDAALAGAVLARVQDATPPQAAYVASLAAAVAVMRMGNRPVDRQGLWDQALARPELFEQATGIDGVAHTAR